MFLLLLLLYRYPISLLFWTNFSLFFHLPRILSLTITLFCFAFLIIILLLFFHYSFSLFSLNFETRFFPSSYPLLIVSLSLYCHIPFYLLFSSMHPFLVFSLSHYFHSFLTFFLSVLLPNSSLSLSFLSPFLSPFLPVILPSPISLLITSTSVSPLSPNRQFRHGSDYPSPQGTCN